MAEFYIPPTALARDITLSIDHRVIVAHHYDAPGTYTLTAPLDTYYSPNPTMTISSDRTFSPPADRRDLGIILIAAGFRP